MNFYQIHIPVKSKTPKNRLKYINSVLNQIKNGDTYTLISTDNFLNKCQNVQFLPIDDVLIPLFNRYPYFKICWDKLFAQNQADLIRMFLLGRTPDMLYLDTDIQLKDYPKFNNDNELPYFANSTRFQSAIDFNLIYNNNAFDWFKGYLRRLEIVLEGNQIHLLNDKLDITKLWRQLRIYAREFKYNKINEDFFIHHNLMGK